MNIILSLYLLQFSILPIFRKINWFLPPAMLLGCFHFCTVTLHLMVNDALSAIVPIVTVTQLPISIVVDKMGTIKSLATPG